MNFARLFSLSLFFSTIFSFSLYTSSNDFTYAQEWALQCRQHMSDQELQILTNIVYLLYANAVVDEKIQQFVTPITRLTQSIIHNMNNTKNPNNELTTLKTLLERLSIVTGTRIIYTETLESCFDYYNQHQVKAIEIALQALQLHGQEILCAHTHENNEAIAADIKNCEQTLTEHAQLFNTASGFYKGLREGELPVETTPQNKTLVTLGISLQNAQIILNSINNVTNIFNNHYDQSIKIISNGLMIYKEHYDALYALITTPSVNQQYTRTMFSMHGLLSEEYQSQLPQSDLIFEHMLHTTKMYTQAEFN